MKKSKLFAVLAGLVLTVTCYAATFNQFGPVTGILKGSSTSPITTAATSTDVRGLWTGSCSSSTFLRGDGACSTPTVTGAALTKTDDTNVTLALGGTPTTALLQSTSLTLGWTGTLAASRGGLGMSTVTDDTVAVANGSTWQSKALTDCDAASSAVTYDTTTNAWGCNTISSTSFANPSGTIGLSAVNGVATTAARSDSSPPLSQSITPVWTGIHKFTAGIENWATNPLYYLKDATGATTYAYLAYIAGEGYLSVEANAPLNIRTNGTARAIVGASGGITVGSPTGGNQGNGTINATGLYVNGAAVTSGAAKTAYAYLDLSAGTCAVSGSPFSSVNVSACARTGTTGITNVTVTGFSTRPVCTATFTAGATAHTIYALATGSTNVVVTTTDSAGVGAWDFFNLTCFGT